MIHLSTTSPPRRTRLVTAFVVWVGGLFVFVSSFGSLLSCEAFSVHPSSSVVVSSSSSSSSSLQSSPRMSRGRGSNSRETVVLQALSPEHFDPVVLDQWMQHVSAAAASSSSSIAATSALDSFVSSSPPWSSQWLAGAATAAAGDAPEKIGWWQQYLLIFKGALTLVHNTIDGPLRSLGIEHTWGPSIAIFTARKFDCFFCVAGSVSMSAIFNQWMLQTSLWQVDWSRK